MTPLTPTNNTLSSLMRKYYKDSASMLDLMDIVTFAESPVGLKLKLYPAQRFILRVFYGLDLQTQLQEPIIIKDGFNEHIVEKFYDERDFFDYLYQEKRINMSLEAWESNKGQCNEILLICGRRASKNVLTSIITVHQLYLLLSIQDPHRYFNVMPSDAIGVILVSNSEDGANRIYNSISNMLQNSKFFRPYIASASLAGGMWLMSDSFKDEVEQGVTHATNGNIWVQASAATGKVRGGSNIIVVMDEIAHFYDSDSQSKNLHADEDIYRALTPSIWGFVSPETGRGAGKSFVLSSPNGKRGLLYDFYKKSFGQNNRLMINTPSNWINPQLAPDTIKDSFNQSELGYRQEFLAEFIDITGNWITDLERLYACFDSANKNVMQQRVDAYHFLGLDLAFTNDRSVIAVGHCQTDIPQVELGKLAYYDMLAKDGLYYVIDYIHIFEARKGIPISPDVVLDTLRAVYNRFRIFKGTADQYSGEIFKNLVRKTPNVRLEIESATAQNNSDRAVLMKQLIMEGRLIMPDIEMVRLEFQALQETNSKGYIRVANDRGHDDIYSAVSRAIENAHKYHKLQAERVVSHTRFIGGNIFRTPSRVVQGGAFKSSRKIHNTGNPMRDLKVSIKTGR